MHNVKKEKEKEKQFVCTSCFEYALLAEHGFSRQMQTARRQKALEQQCPLPRDALDEKNLHSEFQ